MSKLHHRQIVAGLLVALSFGFLLTAGANAEAFETESGFTIIDSISQLRESMGQSDQKWRMKPGTYRVESAWPDDPRSVFICEGAGNMFDMRGVTIEVPASIYRDMRGPVHSLAGYRIRGDNNAFKGATFKNVGDDLPHRSLSEFSVTGDGSQFVDCQFIVRGSAPYGYGDLLGKGSGSAVRLQKHSCMAVLGDNTRIDGCKFDMRTFGHSVHLHGDADHTVIRGSDMRGELRPSSEIYNEKTGPAAELDYKLWHPEWKRGQPIPKDEMIHLAEDGIRAYNDNVGRITIKNCKIVRMRGGITISSANTPARVTGCTVTDCRHSYALPSGSVVRDCRGNATMGPLLGLPRGRRANTDIELQLMNPHQSKGDHVLAGITGNGHRIRITALEGYEAKQPRPIEVGRSSALFAGRWTGDRVDEHTLNRRHSSEGVTLINETPHPVRLTQYSRNCTVKSRGPVIDDGIDNNIERIR